jgi:hypothetical protein
MLLLFWLEGVEFVTLVIVFVLVLVVVLAVFDGFDVVMLLIGAGDWLGFNAMKAKITRSKRITMNAIIGFLFIESRAYVLYLQLNGI